MNRLTQSSHPELHPSSLDSRIHVIVPIVAEGTAPALFEMLDAIRQPDSDLLVSVSLSIAESVAPEALRLVRASENSLHFSVTKPGSTVTELCNKGLAVRPLGADVLLLDPAVKITAASIRYMADVLHLDDMIGFVGPRSNVPALAQFPRHSEADHPDRSSAEKLFGALSPLLPRFHFVPAPPCDCVVIRAEVLDEFGLLDCKLPDGRSAILDLFLRANRCGFAAVLANRAYAWRANPAEAAREWRQAVERNGASYPELRSQIDAYRQGPQHEADRLLTGLVPEQDGRRRILFDLSNFTARHNGTFHAARQILASAAQQWKSRFRILAMSTCEARHFHRLEDIGGIEFVGLEYDQPCAAAFRFGQPFAREHVQRMGRAAPVNVWGMLDTIAWDCLYLRRLDLEEIWLEVLEYSDAVIFISEAVERQFHLRFRARPSLRQQVIYPSLNGKDYGTAESAESPGSYLLIIGNAFAHKRVRETAAAVSAALPDLEIVCIGSKGPAVPHLRFYESGNLTEATIHQLLNGARAVIFPSTHEGFGLPVLQGLAHGKPVIARSLPATRELCDRLGGPANLLLYSSTPDLLNLLRDGVPKWEPETLASEHDWDAAGEQIAVLLDTSISDVRYEEVLVPRIRSLHRKRVLGAPEPGELAQRVADLENSLSWRITRPLRTVAGVLLWLRARASRNVLGARSPKRSG
jgi:glycosyltransferase involved in cell wall biosynthesis